MSQHPRGLVQGSLPDNAPPYPITSGYVSKNQPAPLSFDDPLYVIIPSHDPSDAVGPLDWSADHGTSLPLQGAPVVCGQDEYGQFHLLSWSDISGVTPTNADDTGALNEYVASGRAAYIPDGTYTILGPVNVPQNGQDFYGGGSGRTVFNLGADGVFNFGNLVDGSPFSGGTCRGFTVNGQNVATSAIRVNSCTGRVWQDVYGNYTTGDSWQLLSAQNNEFRSCGFGACFGNALTLDMGAGGHVLSNCEFIAYAGYAVAFRSTIAPSVGAYPAAAGPSDNTFYACRLEAPGFNLDGNSLGMVYHGAGLNNTFHGCGFGGDSGNVPTTTPYSMFTMEIAGLATLSGLLTFTDCGMPGPGGTLSTMLTMRGNCSATLTNCFVEAFENAYVTTNTDSVSRTNVTLATGIYGVTNEWVQGSGPATNCTTVLGGKDATPWVLVTYGASNWADAGGPFAPASFRRIGNLIQPRGVTEAGTSPTTTIATGLPAPAHVLTYPLAVSTGSPPPSGQQGLVLGEFNISGAGLVANLNVPGQLIFLDSVPPYELDQ